jgi:hypothetical protein
MRRLLTLLIVAALATGLSASAAQARKSVHGPGFRAYAPSGWHVDKGSKRGVWSMTIRSPGGPGVRRGAATVSVLSARVSTVERLLKIKSVGDKNTLVQQLIQIPPDATLVQAQYNPTPTTLARVAGTAFGVTYNLRGAGVQHAATVVEYDGRIDLLEVVLTQGLSDLSTTAADMVRGTWSWR